MDAALREEQLIDQRSPTPTCRSTVNEVDGLVAALKTIARRAAPAIVPHL
jgi:hypothetical protein